jgi:hypothetical protein
MSRTGTHDNNIVPADKVPAFLVLLDAISVRTGSENSACNACGLSSGHIRRIRSGDQNMSVTVAQKIMNIYRSLKGSK